VSDNNQTTATSSWQEGELTFIELLKVLGAHKKSILGITAGTIVVAVLYAFLTTPVYRAEVIIAPASEASSTGGISSLMSRFGGLSSIGGLSGLGRRDSTTQAVVTLGSPSFTRDFIKDHNLLPVLFAGKWDAEAGEWDVGSPEDVPTLADGYALFDKQIREIEEEDAGVVMLAVEWNNPRQAADWANELIRRLNEKLRKRAIDEANQTIDYLNKELEKTRTVEIQQAIYYMIENQINLRTMANVREEFAFKVISPAIAADEDRFVRPQRSLLIISGAVAGLCLGIFVSFLLFAVGRIKRELDS